MDKKINDILLRKWKKKQIEQKIKREEENKLPIFLGWPRLI